MDNWAVDQLSVFLGFDPETLKSQVLPYLFSFDNPTSLSEHLQEMLGTSNDTLDFIHKFVQQQFPSSRSNQSTNNKPSINKSTSTETTYSSNQNQNNTSSSSSSSQFPSLPPNTMEPTSWPSNMTVYMKESNVKSKTKKQSKSSNGSLVSDRLEKKKSKSNNNMTLESALKELDINVKQGGKRKVCQCQATKHDLLTIAPNCLNCGKIICVLEGIGPCSFCGTPVLSKEQQVSLIAEAKKKRSEQKQKQHQQLQQQRKAAKATTQAVGYASKVSGDVVSRFIFDQQMEDEHRQRAELHKEKLLEFQRTSAQRSTVIDQATDFTLPTDQSNPWLTAEERAMQLKKQQANMKKLDGRMNQRRVLTIDIGKRQAKVDNVVDESSSDEEQIQTKTTTTTSSGTFANNPLLKGIQGPQFRGSGKKGQHKQQERKSRIQFDDNSIE
ncbi:putative zinc finger motif, C2HC5-type-domain-containing protein [Halteromyces radiatus]|uniref:putative zinc finger motif, C2HC5-type-domain-containing protein n=1 Tax=Halteromyces radiatus TaxID=101107 RepID=UPI0022210D09|nr:putative zinc finger motif, C2HC5-type-domain-containing protein [Halteromyces radiatus]KAI8093550.1 putative zinc finger motif, C2HC5-type-domain-containing protein [Halteromyces radiatus]